MTKYEWDRELKKNIHRLPDDEIKRVLEYYDELFEDYIERGKSEREIIAEFGNPCDVADKILADYDGELKSDDPFGHPPRFRGDKSGTVFEGHDDNKTDVKSNAKEPWEVDYFLYKEWHLVECFFQKLKWFRRVATRYDKLDKP